MQSPFDDLGGVLSVTVGYSGGDVEHPSYAQVCSGKTGHREVALVCYDAERISYEALLAVFWRQIDPCDDGGQFADRGDMYQTVIYYFSEQQRVLAESSREALGNSGVFDRSLVTEILPAQTFYAAEQAHQCYYQTHSDQYKRYRLGSGREAFLNRVWKCYGKGE